MGRYVYGNQQFSYKYIFGAQPTNLSELEEWSGVGVAETMSTLKTQLYLPYNEEFEESMTFVTGVSHLTCVYESVIAPTDIGVDLSPYFEQAIYQIGDDWKQGVAAIDETLPGPAINPDLCLAHSYSFWREDWAALAAKIGHGADVGDVESLKRARAIVFESGEDDYLPLLAVNALIHAITHQIEAFVLVDGDEGHTNLWDVVDDYAGPYDPEQSWEERAIHARMLSFQAKRREKAIELLEQLAAERPSALTTAQALISQYLWLDRWTDIFDLTNALLDSDQTDSSRASLLMWRGEACWNLGKMPEARSDAEASAELGRTELLDALAHQSSESSPT